MPLPPPSLTSLPGRFYTGAWGYCTGSTPDPTASFSKQCRILLTGLKFGTEHRGVGLGSPNTHISCQLHQVRDPCVVPLNWAMSPPPHPHPELKDLKAGESTEVGGNREKKTTEKE